MSPSVGEHGVGRLVVDRLRRQEHGDAARLRHRIQVDLGQEGGVDVPHPGLRALQVGGEADEWFAQRNGATALVPWSGLAPQGRRRVRRLRTVQNPALAPNP